jgi:hypothetical protein
MHLGGHSTIGQVEMPHRLYIYIIASSGPEIELSWWFKLIPENKGSQFI